ncbi:non-specific lipid-transfer protein 2-like [Momordica charantia]|uniref:Non-specific lipid-transfer protein 2-like n=1 Tax=Momordica charantia TaxID=3673 RepID=A0A6J1E135_MOMCH|nr:non-specific lipid-transfer protein 2-like [Momordica charantia]
MKKFQVPSLCLLVAVVATVALLSGARSVEAACNPMELSPCLGAITSSAPPSTVCCQKLKQQQPCFCEYAKDPRMKPYVESPRAKAVASICRIAVPRC